MEEDVVYCPRCAGKLVFSPGESTITKAKYNCPNDNCKKEYTRNTVSGDIVEVSVVVGALTALAGIAWTIGHFYFTGKPPPNN